MAAKTKRFVMVTTDKGGTGKTVFSRALADRYLRDKTRALLVDGDGEIGGLYQTYCRLGNDGSPVEQRPDDGVLSIRVTGDEKERDALLATLDFDFPVVLVDMPAASITALEKIDAELGFFDELDRAGYRATLVNVLSPFRSSTRTVKQMIELGGRRADYVAVVNRWFGDDDDFFLWFGDENHARSKGRDLLPEHGGKEIELPKLQAGVLVAVDDLSLRFAAAVEHPDLSRAQRSRLFRWMRDMDAQLDRIAPYIGLGEQS